jgi:hypothetical protein
MGLDPVRTDYIGVGFRVVRETEEGEFAGRRLYLGEDR